MINFVESFQRWRLSDLSSFGVSHTLLGINEWGSGAGVSMKPYSFKLVPRASIVITATEIWPEKFVSVWKLSNFKRLHAHKSSCSNWMRNYTLTHGPLTSIRCTGTTSCLWCWCFAHVDIHGWQKTRNCAMWGSVCARRLHGMFIFSVNMAERTGFEWYSVRDVIVLLWRAISSSLPHSKLAENWTRFLPQNTNRSVFYTRYSKFYHPRILWAWSCNLEWSTTFWHEVYRSWAPSESSFTSL